MRYSFEFRPDQRRTFELKVKKRAFDTTKAFNTIDNSTATASTTRNSNSKFNQSRKQERSQLVQSLMCREKTPKKNRTIMSHMSPRAGVQVQQAPKLLKFSSQPLQIFTDLDQIHRKIDEGEIKLDIESIKEKKIDSLAGVWSLASEALEANLQVER